MENETNIVIFNAIVRFVKDLREQFDEFHFFVSFVKWRLCPYVNCCSKSVVQFAKFQLITQHRDNLNINIQSQILIQFVKLFFCGSSSCVSNVQAFIFSNLIFQWMALL